MTTRNYRLVTELDTLKRLIDKLGEDDGAIGYDIETGYDGPPKLKGALFPAGGAFTVGFSITNDPKWARYVPLRHDFGPNLDPDVVWPLMKPLLEQPRIVPHHAKFEKKFARQVDIELGILADTMLAAYVLSEWRSTGLKELVLALFGRQMTKIIELFPEATVSELKCLRFNVLDQKDPKVYCYACDDASEALAVYQKIDARARRERPFMYRLEHQISEIMVDVESWGTAVDWTKMQHERAYAETFMAKYEAYVKAELGALAGRDLTALKLNSTKQMKELLYNELGLTTTTKTKSGADSVNAIALETLSQQHPPIKALLQLREVQNLRNRHVKWLEEKKEEVPIKGLDGRVHANYAQTIVGTGRFAANDPPIQQCPKDWFWALGEWDHQYQKSKDKTAAIKEIVEKAPSSMYWKGNFRDYIVPAEGWYFLGYDYSQIELRVMAGLSQEAALLKAFNEDMDVHTLTAAMMLGKHPDDVDLKIERPIGKTMNFALLYGMGPKSLAERLGITFEKAKQLYRAYFAGFSSITTWMDKCKMEGKQNGATESHFGRRYKVWELESSNKAIYAKGERVLVNAPVQGGAADYMKVAMVRAASALKKAGWWGTKVKMVANLHDALTFEVHESLSPQQVRSLLEPAVVFDVKGFPKIVADWEIGYVWGNSQSWKKGKSPAWTGTCWELVSDGEASSTSDEFPALDTYLITTSDEEDDEVIPLTEEELQAIREVQPLNIIPPPTEDEKAVADATEQLEMLAPTSSGKTLVVEVTEMPTGAQFEKLISLVRMTPGNNKIRLKTPEGEVELDAIPTTGLGIDDQPRVSLLLGGAQLYFPAEDVEDEVLLMGLTL